MIDAEQVFDNNLLFSENRRFNEWERY